MSGSTAGLVSAHSTRRLLTVTGLAVAAAAVLGGCKGAGPNMQLIEQVSIGEHGKARKALAADLPKSADDREYLRQRLRLAPLEVADGLAPSAEPLFQDINRVLDTKGLNKDKALVATVLNEDLKIWKGEPFEQALAWHYMALRNGCVGDWDNMRNAAGSSLFLLADFGTNEKGERKSTEEIAKAAGASKTAGKDSKPRNADTDTGGSGPDAYDTYLTNGYVTTDSNFTLGYLMNGVASQAMNRTDEARANFANAVKYNPALKEMVATLESGQYNTVFVVDFGQGPQKVGYGMDNALAKFQPWPGFASDGRPLNVRIAGGSTLCVPVAQDINVMAADHMWNNLQDVRRAKSVFGTVAIGAGAAMAASGNRDVAIAGLFVALGGAIAKAGAHADTRYCEVMPQRIYFVPVQINSAGTTVEMQVGDDQFSRMVLTGLCPPAAPEKYQVRSVRLNHGRIPAAWALSGQVLYGNDACSATVAGADLPYILGGRCVCAPSSAALQRYQKAGNLTGMVLSDLENLYRAEGITWAIEDEAGQSRLHVLEGGTSLVTPQAGTAGFARLFGQEHAPYSPKSKELQQFRASMVTRTASAAAVR